MGEPGDAVFVLDVLDHIESLVAAPAAGAVGAGDKIGFKRRELGDRVQEVPRSLVRPGREEFERVGPLSLLKNFFYFCHRSL